MAYMRDPKTPEEVKKMTVANLKKEYNAIADSYRKILDNDVVRCVDCGDWLAKSNFYISKKYKTAIYPVCKKCVLKRVQQIDKKDDKPNETKESVINMMREMDLPYVDSLYDSCCQSVVDNVGEKVKSSPFMQMLTAILSLPQYKNKTFKDSELPVETESYNSNRKVKQSTIKRFGQGLSQDDYLFLQDQYEDWITRYEANTKAQEELFERLCFKKLEIFKATREGKSTKDLDRSYQDLMSTANITPRQNSLDVLSEGQTLGQLIEKWETERPIPEPEESLKDVDRIGTYIDVFYKGHMAKLLNLKNPLQNIYEKFIKKYTVTKPEYDEDSDSEELFDKIFGKTEEG